MAGTLVRRFDGHVGIEELQAGDWVAPYLDGCESERPEDPVVVWYRGASETVSMLYDRQEAPLVGDVAELHLDELGVTGPFVVEAVQEARGAHDVPHACPVLGTVHRLARDRVDLSVAGPDGTMALVETTSSHPFHSFDRGAWVAADALEMGERLVTSRGTVTLVGIVGRHDPEWVHNIWVGGSHRYYVSELELDVHNKCWVDKALDAMGLTRADLEGMPNPHGHHIIPKGMTNSNSASIRRMVADLQEMARRHGMTDIVNDRRNLTVSPLGGVHSEAAIARVHARLMSAGRRSSSHFFEELNILRWDIFDGRL